MGSRGEGDMGIVRRFYPELDLSSRHGIEVVLQFVFSVKRWKRRIVRNFRKSSIRRCSRQISLEVVIDHDLRAN